MNNRAVRWDHTADWKLGLWQMYFRIIRHCEVGRSCPILCSIASLIVINRQEDWGEGKTLPCKSATSQTPTEIFALNHHGVSTLAQTLMFCFDWFLIIAKVYWIRWMNCSDNCWRINYYCLFNSSPYNITWNFCHPIFDLMRWDCLPNKIKRRWKAKKRKKTRSELAANVPTYKQNITSNCK